MKIVDLFFITIVLVACMFGTIIAFGSAPDPSKAIDSYNNTASGSTNSSAVLINKMSSGYTTGNFSNGNYNGGVPLTPIYVNASNHLLSDSNVTNMTFAENQTYVPGMIPQFMGFAIIGVGIAIIIVLILFFVSAFKKLPGQGYRRG